MNSLLEQIRKLINEIVEEELKEISAELQQSKPKKWFALKKLSPEEVKSALEKQKKESKPPPSPQKMRSAMRATTRGVELESVEEAFGDMAYMDVGSAVKKEETTNMHPGMSINSPGAPLSEERLSLSWGVIPPVEVLNDLMQNEPYEMDLKGSDSYAYDYAMTLSDDPLAGDTDTGEGMKATLEALLYAPPPKDLSGRDLNSVTSILHQYNIRYDEPITDATSSLAMVIMDSLGVEWI